jgi:hypothetical protein
MNDIQTEIYTALTAFNDCEKLPESEREELKERVLAYLDTLAEQEADKADAIAFAMRRAKAEIEFLKEEEIRLRSMRKIAQKEIERFNEYLKSVFLKHGLQRVKGRKYTLYLRRSKQVEINVSPQELPEKFVNMRINFVADKKALKTALEKGMIIEGARIKENISLSIR